jgi:hypothetical protein
MDVYLIAAAGRRLDTNVCGATSIPLNDRRKQAVFSAQAAERVLLDTTDDACPLPIATLA